MQIKTIPTVVRHGRTGRFDVGSVNPSRELTMSVNIGTIDRTARFVVGAALITYGWTSLADAWLWTAVIVGIALTVTALVGICPAYSIFGVSTCQPKLKAV